MDEIFQELRGAGDLHSSGAFTLDLGRAQELLATRGMQPGCYPLALAAAAELSGASFLKVRVDLDDVEMEWDGTPLTAADVLDLPRAGLRGHYLALGLAGARALSPRQFFLDLEDGTLDLTGSTPRPVEAASRPAGVSTRVRVKERIRLAALWSQGVLRRFPEVDLLRGRCAYMALTLTVNGRAVNRPVDLGACLAWTHLKGAGRLVVPSCATPAPVHRSAVAAGPFSAVVALAGNRNACRQCGLVPSRGGPSCLTFVVQGVACHRTGLRLGSGCLRGVVSSPDLKHDLSLSAVVEDELFERILGELRYEVENMLSRLVATTPGRFRVAFEEAADLLAARGDLAGVEPVYRSLSERTHARELALGHLEQGQPGLAVAAARKCDRTQARFLNGCIGWQLGDLPEAMECFERDLAGLAETSRLWGWPEEGARLLTDAAEPEPLDSLAVCRFQMGDLPRAREACERALEARRAAGENPAETLAILALVAREQGRLEEAGQQIGRALALQPCQFERAACLNFLARLALDRKDFPEAIRLGEEAVDLYTATLGRDSWAVGRSVAQLAEVWRAAGYVDQARVLWRQVLGLDGDLRAALELARTSTWDVRGPQGGAGRLRAMFELARATPPEAEAWRRLASERITSDPLPYLEATGPIVCHRWAARRKGFPASPVGPVRTLDRAGLRAELLGETLVSLPRLHSLNFRPGELVDHLQVPAGQPQAVFSRVVLERDRAYWVKASGVVSRWDDRKDGVDAFYGYAAWRVGPKPLPWASLILNDQSMLERARETGFVTDYRRDHTYQALLIGSGRCLKLQDDDARMGSWHDNRGAYTVRIYAAQA
ncbi:MAG: tetratricopeptide repeat protein [Candidatus Eremiobacterota bacterium]